MLTPSERHYRISKVRSHQTPSIPLQLKAHLQSGSKLTGRSLSCRNSWKFAKRHQALRSPSARDRLMAADHLLLSMSSSRSDEVDEALASRDLARRIVMRVPHALAAVIALLRSNMLATVTQGAAHIFGEIAPLVRVELPFSVPAAEFRLVWNRRLDRSPGILGYGAT